MAKASSKLRTAFHFTAVAALVMLSSTTFAENTDPEAILEDCSVPMTASSASFEHALRVWIDPITGKLREPTAEERQALAKHYSLEALLNRSHDGLVMEVKPNGAKIVHLQGRFMHVLVATTNEDGTLTTECINDKDELTKAKTASVPVR